MLSSQVLTYHDVEKGLLFQCSMWLFTMVDLCTMHIFKTPCIYLNKGVGQMYPVARDKIGKGETQGDDVIQILFLDNNLRRNLVRYSLIFACSFDMTSSVC